MIVSAFDTPATHEVAGVSFVGRALVSPCREVTIRAHRIVDPVDRETTMPFKSVISVSIFALCAGTAFASAEPVSLVASTPSVSVIGHASEWVVPDEARAVAALAGSGPTPAAAIADVAAKATRVVDIVRKANIPDDETASAGPDIEPLYKHVYDAQGREIMEKREPNGFRATYRLTLRTGDLALLGKLVPQLTDASATIEGISFNVSTIAAIRARLETKAVADGVARAKAQIEAAGAKPGRMLEIGAPMERAYAPAMARMVAAPPAPAALRDFAFALRPGKEEISAERQVVMEMVP
jgi:uncharacterized protein YggE